MSQQLFQQLTQEFGALKATIFGDESKAQRPAGKLGDWMHRRAKAVDKAEAIVKGCETAKRDMTETEKKEFNDYMAEAKELTPHIERVIQSSKIRTSGEPGPTVDRFRAESLFQDIVPFGRQQEGRLSPSALVEGSGGGAYLRLNPTELETFIQATPSINPFQQAGANVKTFPDFAFPIVRIPFVLPGNTVTTFAESSGPSSATDANIKKIDISPSKYSFLTKLSEELEADSADLSVNLGTEGVRRVQKSISDAISTALITSLTSAGAVHVAGMDNLESLLDLEAAKDPLFGSFATDCFMGSRSTLAKLRNTRDEQNRPIFDPISRTLLGYKWVTNDGLAGRLIFGDFGTGVFARFSALIIQRLTELYSESGTVGIKFLQRAGAAFYSDASNGTSQPLVMLTEDFGS